MDAPEIAWEVIKEINLIEVYGGEWRDHLILAVGCGPLENLIALHSNKLLDSILLDAKQNEKLGTQLSMIYEASVNKEIWLKIQNTIVS